jgi:two-component system response regulator DesR
MIRLLIADDEDLLRSALAALLALEPDLTVVAEAATSTDAVRLAREHRPDIAVLDLEMPPADGLHAAARIMAALPGARIVLVTRHARPGVLRRALAAGVSGFVPKTTLASRLAEIIRDVAAGRRYIDTDIAASALTEGPCPLTDRELDVLRASRTGAVGRGDRRPGAPRARHGGQLPVGGHGQTGLRLPPRCRPPRLGGRLDLIRGTSRPPPHGAVGYSPVLGRVPRSLMPVWCRSLAWTRNV